MKNFITLCLGAVFFSTCLLSSENQSGSTSANEALMKEISKGFSAVSKKAIPAVVYIESHGVQEQDPRPKQFKRQPYDNPFDYFHDELFNHFFGIPQERKRQPEVVRGSGFLVTDDGYILTNNHVVENASKVTVTLYSGKKMTATIIGTDPKTDLAIIKIEKTNLPFLTLGDSDDLEVGDWAIAIGNPFGLHATVTVGVISAKGRNQLHIAEFEDFIQTDAAINMGNSGGPLLNVHGEVIGVNTAILSGSGGYMGVGFAIPTSMAKRIKDQLIKDGQVTRGFLGVTLQPLDEELAGYYGLDTKNATLVTDVISGSPADKAGLKQEDVILSYNNIPVENLGAFRNYVSLMTPDSKLSLKINREGKIITINVQIASTPEEKVGLDSPVQKLGLKVQNLTPELAKRLGYSSDKKGVVITEVADSGPAHEASLQPGSLIVAVNRKKVENMDEFNQAINDAIKNERVLLMVRQGEIIRFVALHFE